MEKNKRIIFDLPEEITHIEVIDEILKNKGLEESAEDFYNKDIKGIEPRLIIVRDAALVLFTKTAPEKKLTELLAKHLETEHKTAENIISELKEKLLPYAKIVKEPEEEVEKEISEPKPEIAPAENLPYAKKIEIKNVEDNAKKMEAERVKAKTVVEQTPSQYRGSDPYHESIE